jgi:putative oxidoreductase
MIYPNSSCATSCKQCNNCNSHESITTRNFHHPFSISSPYTLALQCSLLFLLRLYWGISFLATGCYKLMNIEALTPYFIDLGMPLAFIMIYRLILTEMIGGLGLLLGFKSRLVALILIINMLGTYYTAYYPALVAIFYQPSLFVKAPPFSYLLVSLIIYSFGPGRVCIDYFKKSTR